MNKAYIIYIPIFFSTYLYSMIGTKPPINKKLFFPNCGQNTHDLKTLDLRECDPICGEPFIKLIKQQEKKRLGFIIAHVITRKNNKSYGHWYAAEMLNKWLFNGQVVPGGTRILNPVNPVNRITIEKPADINYFAIHNLKEDFFHLGNGVDLLENECLGAVMRTFLLFFHTPCSLTENLPGSLLLGKVYSEGAYNIPQDFARAEKYYSYPATQESNKIVQAEGLLGLAAIFTLDKPLALRDWDKGLAYLTKAYEVSFAIPESSAHWESCLGLSFAYHYGLGGVTKNLKKARKYLKEIILESGPRYDSVRTRAHVNLARIYKEQRKYKKYLEQLKPLAHDNNFLDLKADAQLELAQFYSQSSLNNSKDLDKAEFYYEAYFANPSLSEHKKVDARYQCAMALLQDASRLEKSLSHFKTIASSSLINEQGKDHIQLHMANIALRAFYTS